MNFEDYQRAMIELAGHLTNTFAVCHRHAGHVVRIDVLAKELNLPRRTVQSHLHQLEKMSFMDIAQSRFGVLMQLHLPPEMRVATKPVSAVDEITASIVAQAGPDVPSITQTTLAHGVDYGPVLTQFAAHDILREKISAADLATVHATVPQLTVADLAKSAAQFVLYLRSGRGSGKVWVEDQSTYWPDKFALHLSKKFPVGNVSGQPTPPAAGKPKMVKFDFNTLAQVSARRHSVDDQVPGTGFPDFDALPFAAKEGLCQQALRDLLRCNLTEPPNAVVLARARTLAVEQKLIPPP